MGFVVSRSGLNYKSRKETLEECLMVPEATNWTDKG
jgi:hypothetical protein